MNSNYKFIEMQVYAYFKSVKTASHGIKTFRYNTEFRSIYGSGNPIGLIVMLNPGSAEPESAEITKKLKTEEFETNKPVLVNTDKTIERVMRLIYTLYENNNRELPKEFTIHIENLFNLKEKDNVTAKKLVKKISEHNDLMFLERQLEEKYDFVFFAWGNTKINIERQAFLNNKFNNEAICVKTTNVNYPVHPLYMNTEYFIKASKGKLFSKVY